jgi:hypothetical protein
MQDITKTIILQDSQAYLFYLARLLIFDHDYLLKPSIGGFLRDSTEHNQLLDHPLAPQMYDYFRPESDDYTKVIIGFNILHAFFFDKLGRSSQLFIHGSSDSDLISHSDFLLVADYDQTVASKAGLLTDKEYLALSAIIARLQPIADRVEQSEIYGQG